MLTTAPNLEDADDFYEALIDAHRDLTATQSHALNARLVLLLANHIGTLDVLRTALDAARRNTLATLPAAPGDGATRPSEEPPQERPEDPPAGA